MSTKDEITAIQKAFEDRTKAYIERRKECIVTNFQRLAQRLRDVDSTIPAHLKSCQQCMASVLNQDLQLACPGGLTTIKETIGFFN